MGQPTFEADCERKSALFIADQRKLWGPQSLRTLLDLGRVSNLPTIVSNVLAAVYVGVGGSLSEKSTREIAGILVLCFFAILVYCGGMFLNDYFDAEYDSTQERLAHRPIPSGRVSRNFVGLLGFTQLAAGLLLYIGGYGALHALAVSLWPLSTALLLIAAVLIYDAFHKKNPLSPLLMASCRSLLYLSVALFFVDGMSSWLGKLIVLNFFYLVGLTTIAKSEGKEKQGRSSVLLVSYCVFLPSLMIFFEMPLFTVVIFAAFVSFLSCMIAKKREQMGKIIGQFIAGICILDGLVVYSVSGSMPLFLLFLALYFGTLNLQKLIQGT